MSSVPRCDRSGSEGCKSVFPVGLYLLPVDKKGAVKNKPKS